MSESITPTLQAAGAMLVDRAGRPALTITPYAGPAPEGLRPVDLGDGVRQTILALLRAAPGLALAGQAGTAGVYTLRFAPHAAAQLATGQASLMQAAGGGVRAMAVDAQGRIVAHGALVPLAGVGPGLVALGLWQALAVITAQHYLADIQRGLRQIAAAIEALRRWHEDRELGQIVSDHAYLARTRDLLLAGPVADAERAAIIGQLEQIEREAGRVVAARRLSFDRSVEQARSQPLGSPAWWAVEQQAEQLLGHIAAAAADLQVVGMGLGLQAAAAHTQAALLGRGRKGADLLGAVATAAEQARAQWADLAAVVSRRLPEITSVSDVRRVARNVRARVALEVNSASALVALPLAALRDAARAAARPEPQQLIVRLGAEGELATFVPAGAELPAPETPDLAARDAARRLAAVDGMTLASFDDLQQARERFRLSDGTAVHDFTNFAGFRHVYLVRATGACVFGGFVPPTHAGQLRQALAAIRAAAA